MKVLQWFWTNRTRTFAFIQGLVATLATLDSFAPKTLKALLIANAVLTYCLGQFNSWSQNRSTQGAP